MSVYEVLSGIRVSVFNRGGTTLQTIYQRETGVTQGPSPEAAATGTNPITTGASGAIQFWAEQGRYDLLIHDTNVPARIADRTIQWNAVPLDAIPIVNLETDIATQAELNVVSGAATQRFLSGTFAARPGAGASNGFYWATDRNQLYYSNGSTWQFVAAPQAAKAFMSSINGAFDGSAHYAFGTNYPTVSAPTPYLTNPAPSVSAAISLLYPVEFGVSGYSITYAGPGTQYVQLEVLNQAAAVAVANEPIVALNFQDFHIERIMTPTQLAAAGAAGTWTARLRGASDGVRTSGARNVNVWMRERPDLL